MRRISMLLPLALVFLAIAACSALAGDFLLEVQSGGPGTVSPPDYVVVPAGGSQTFTFTPSGCYTTGEVTVDEVPVGTGITSYTFTNVQSDHLLYVPFVLPGTTTSLDVRPALGHCAVPETLTATVANASGGQVQFFQGTTLLGARALSGGIATYVLTAGLPGGSYTFQASFAGTSCVGASDSPVVAYDVVDTGPSPLTLALTVTPSSAPLQSVIAASTTLRSGGDLVLQTGQVTYYDGATVLGIVAMRDGRSSLQYTLATPGVHVLSAVAHLNQCPGSGDIASAPQNVVGTSDGPTSMTLSITPAQAEPGQSVVLAAALNTTYATGVIRFLDITNGAANAVEVGRAPLVNGAATYTYGPLTLPSRTLQGVYDGDAYFPGCSSNPSYLQIGHETAAILADSWVTNGPVNSIVYDASSIYIGGNFTQVGPRTGSAVEIDAGTAAVRQPYLQVQGAVYRVVPDGQGGWYLGGRFGSVKGVPRNNLAHIDADGNVSDWNPNTDGYVFDVELSGGTVYASGNFRHIGGLGRNGIAAIDAVTGVPTHWNPSADGAVFQIEVSNGIVYAGGRFDNIGNKARHRLAAIDAVTSAATDWDPNPDLTPTYYTEVDVLTLSGGLLYVGGIFSSIGGQNRNLLAAIDTTSGMATAWNPSPSAPYPIVATIASLAVDGGTVYVGGQFRNIGGQPRTNFASVDAGSGLATALIADANDGVLALAVSGGRVYAAGQFTQIGGQERGRIAALDAGSGSILDWQPNAASTVQALAVGGNTVFAGGEFNSLGGVRRQNLAALDVVTGAATNWNPGADREVSTLAIAGGTIYAGGWFTSVGPEQRNAIAAIDAETGDVLGWKADANGQVTSLAVEDGVVYAGGWFTNIGAEARNYVAALDATTGVVTAWDPNADAPVYALTVDGGRVYAGGGFTGIGGQARTYIAALDPTSGLATAWKPILTQAPQRRIDYPDGVSALAMNAGTLYVGGYFVVPGGGGLVALDATSGAVTWKTGPFVDYISGEQGMVWSLAVNAGTVYAGGNFVGIAGKTRLYLAGFQTSNGAVTNLNPATNNSVYALALRGPMLYAGGQFSAIGDVNQQGFGEIYSDVSVATLLARFEATNSAGDIELRWSFDDASRVRDVTVERAGSVAGPWQAITPELREESGTTVAVDRTAAGGEPYYYRLTVQLASGGQQTFGPVSATGVVTPLVTALQRLAPNPTRGGTQLQYDVARSERVRIDVLDVAGRVEATLTDKVHAPGHYDIRWDGASRSGRLEPGIHFVRFVAPDRVTTRKLAIVR